MSTYAVIDNTATANGWVISHSDPAVDNISRFTRGDEVVSVRWISGVRWANMTRNGEVIVDGDKPRVTTVTKGRKELVLGWLAS